MAGVTATIDRATLGNLWGEYVPMAAICQQFSISKDQLIRLRVVWELPLRLDRKRRYKPSRLERMLDPDEDELAASEASLDLAPMVAERVTTIQSRWTAEIRADRQVTKPEPFRLTRAEVPEEMRETLDNLNRDYER